MGIEEIELFNDDYKKVIGDVPDSSVDLIVTDPPYEHVMGGMKSKTFNTGDIMSRDSYMNKSMSQFGHEQVFEFLDLVIPKMKKVNMYIFCSKLQLAHYFDYINQHKKLKFDLLVWDKSSPENKYSMKSSKFFAQDIEYVVRIYQSGVSLNKIWNDEKTHADSSYYMKRQKFSKPKGGHETMKPTELLEQYILLSSHNGDTVLDPFMGSGSTGVACVNTNRNFIGIELDKEYSDLAGSRIAKALDSKGVEFKNENG